MLQHTNEPDGRDGTRGADLKPGEEQPIPKPASPAVHLRSHPERARYDRDTVDQILDEALICHLGFVAEGRPSVIPVIHARLGDVIYLHGSPAMRTFKSLKEGVDVCLTVTIVDSIVLARSAFYSTMSYRSVVVMGRTQVVTDPDERLRAFEAIVEHVASGRWADCRRPAPKEDRATTIVRLPINEFSAKVRSGPPRDPKADYDQPYWAGVVPLTLVAGPPEDDPNLKPGLKAPPYAVDYRR